MALENAHQINDKKFLKENNIDIDKLGTKLIKFFNKSIFKVGFLYLDINPRNILIKNDVDSKGRNNLKILFLDHGEYEIIGEEVRYNYSELWRGIFTQNENLIKKASNNLGIENYKLFLTLLTYKTFDDLMDKTKKFAFEDIFNYGIYIYNFLR